MAATQPLVPATAWQDEEAFTAALAAARESDSEVPVQAQRAHPTPRWAPLSAVLLLAGCLLVAHIALTRTPAQRSGTSFVSLAASSKSGASSIEQGPFCFAVGQSTGTELELMEDHWERKRHIFGCPGYSFFSDTDSLGVIPVTNIGAIQSSKGSWGSWANTKVFLRAWHHVDSQGLYRNFEWTIKVDPDTVFVSTHLRSHIHGLNASKPLYLKSPGILMGAVEVFSVAAVRAFVERDGEKCEGEGEYDGVAEDGFIEFCMGRLGVQSHEEKDLLKLATGPAECATPGYLAYHPMKDVGSWSACLGNATQAN